MTFAKTIERWLKRDRYAAAPEAGGLRASTTHGVSVEQRRTKATAAIDSATCS
jgi:hypothetical protein